MIALWFHIFFFCMPLNLFEIIQAYIFQYSFYDTFFKHTMLATKNAKSYKVAIARTIYNLKYSRS